MTDKVQALIDRFGNAEALFVWAEETNTDLRSEFDLLDEEFNTLWASAMFNGYVK